MFKKIKEYFQKKREVSKKLKEIERAKTYYDTLKKGALVLQFIHKDLKDKANKMDRMQRRRMETELKRTGKFSEEIINHYEKHFTKILEYLEKEGK